MLIKIVWIVVNELRLSDARYIEVNNQKIKISGKKNDVTS